MFEFGKKWTVIYLVGQVWNNFLQMLVFLVILKMGSENLQEVKRVYNITKWFVLGLFILNFVILFISIFGKNKMAYCTKKRPNLAGDLLIKACLLLFDIIVFVLSCLNWGVKI